LWKECAIGKIEGKREKLEFCKLDKVDCVGTLDSGGNSRPPSGKIEDYVRKRDDSTNSIPKQFINNNVCHHT